MQQLRWSVRLVGSADDCGRELEAEFAWIKYAGIFDTGDNLNLFFFTDEYPIEAIEYLPKA